MKKKISPCEEIRDLRFFKVKTLPEKPSKNSLYFVKATGSDCFTLYFTTYNCEAIPLCSSGGGGTVDFTVTGTGVTGTPTNRIIDIDTFRSLQSGNMISLSFLLS